VSIYVYLKDKFLISLPSFLSLPPNDFIGGSKESGNDFILCKWFGLIAF